MKEGGARSAHGNARTTLLVMEVTILLNHIRITWTLKTFEHSAKLNYWKKSLVRSIRRYCQVLVSSCQMILLFHIMSSVRFCWLLLFIVLVSVMFDSTCKAPSPHDHLLSRNGRPSYICISSMFETTSWNHRVERRTKTVNRISKRRLTGMYRVYLSATIQE